MRRVAITGIGLITGLGASREETWNGLIEGRCGVRPVTTFETEGYRSRVASEVCLDRVAAAFTPLERRRWSRGDQIGVAAATEALTDSGVLDSGCARERIGVLLGAGTADLLRNESYQHTATFRGIDRARPSQAWNHFCSTPVDIIASRFGLRGLRSCIVAACCRARSRSVRLPMRSALDGWTLPSPAGPTRWLDSRSAASTR